MVGFEVLGPVRLKTGEGEVELTSMLQRLLGLLLARSGRPITVDAIAEALWESDPPRTARKTVQIYVHRLRRLLGDDERITHSETGYRLAASPSEVDAHVFESLADQAATARTRGDLDTADRLLAQALQLWRGPAYTGLRDIPDIATGAARLDERRMTAFEDRIAVELDLGRHAELAGKLSLAIAENPFRERLRGQLMIALYRDGRQAEALEAYRQTRRLLVAEVGVEPNTELQRLHQAILRNDPGLGQAAVTRRKTPSGYRFLPHDIPHFVGRQGDLDWLDRTSLASAPAMVVTAIAGAAGVGKTALAVRWAHRVADLFPDGQLYLNLRGYDPGPPLRPLEALVYFLRCLGVPREQMPTELEEASARYRAILVDREMLIVLDNARSADQVRPLLPGSAGSQVLVTSRDRLSGLVAHDGAKRLTLGLLPDEHALTLLRHALGDTRIDAEPEAVARVIALCGGLPLALRIAAANLADRPTLPIGVYADSIAEGCRIAALSITGDEDRAVKAVLDHSYDALPLAAQRIFRLLGLVPGSDFTVEAVAALAGGTPAQATTALETLASAHLVEQPSPPRYTLHDLVREYAQGRAGGEPPETLTRLLRYLRDMAEHANSFIVSSGPVAETSLAPQLHSAAEAMAWFEAERANLTAASSAAARAGLAELACEIASPMGHFFHFGSYIGDWISTFEVAFAAVEHLGETPAKYFILNSLGNAYNRASRFEEAASALQRAIDGREALDDQRGAGSSRFNLASVYERLGRYEEALVLHESALATFRKYEAADYEALVLGAGLSNVYQRMGLWDKALDCLLQALVMVRESGSPFAIIRTLNNLGWTYRRMGTLALAQQHLNEGLELAREVGDRYTEPLLLAGLADVQQDLGQFDRAIELRTEAHRLILISSRQHETDSLNGLGDLYLAAATPDRALAHYEQALTLATERGEHHQRGRALTGIGRLIASRRHLETAIALLEPIAPMDAEKARRALNQLPA
ncbi:MAG TPA: BTAD domain-containing putative transcriptional regulator [Candidatus Limnocylindrales bacterium]